MLRKMLKQVRDYLLDLDRDQAETPTLAVREFLFDVEPRIYQPELVVPISSIIDNGHPMGLGNPQILRNIFKHLPTSDLINLRRVSIRWNHIACEHLRRNLGHCKLRPSKIKLFLKLMKTCYCNPFGSYALRIERLADLNIQTFLKNFSQEVIRLRLKIASVEIPDFIKLLHKMSNLEELHLIRIPEESRSIRLEYINNPAWKHGVYQFPKLRLITFESDDPTLPFFRNYDTCLIDIINSSQNILKVEFINWDSPLAHLFRRCGLSNPKSFDGWRYSKSNPNLREDLMEIFFVREMKFKALKFIINENVLFELVTEIALRTSDFLYHLSLKNDNHFETFEVSVKLPRLITLGLKGWKGPVEFSTFLDNFPNLKTLKVNRCNFVQITEEPSRSKTECENRLKQSNYCAKNVAITSKTLETLNMLPEMPLEDCAVDAPLMKDIVKMFPTITQLFVQVDGNKALHVIFESLPDLELLCLEVKGQVSDEGFTGIPDGVITITKRHACGCPVFSFPEKTRSPTHIGCLQKLRVLIIRAGKNITNISLLEGIYRLECLNTLLLFPSYQEDGIGNTWCIRAIADSFPNLRRLVTSKDSEYSDADLSYLYKCLPWIEFEYSS